MNPLYLLVAVPVFALLVLVHELGHFVAAKWAGIRVEEFGIGFPPRMFGIKRGETIYSINWLPIGGFVRMTGENGEVGALPEGEEAAAQERNRSLNPLALAGALPARSEASQTNETIAAHGVDSLGAAAPVEYDPRSFGAKTADRRLIVLLAGVTMNILLAFVLLMVAEVIGTPDPARVPSTVGKVVAGSPAEQAGLHSGDHIVSVNGQTITTFTQFRVIVSKLTDDAPATTTTVPIAVLVERKGAAQPIALTVKALAHPGAGQGHFGISADPTGTPYLRTPVWQAPVMAVQDMGLMVTGTVEGVRQIVAGKIPLAQAIAGPVGIVKQTGDFASDVPVSGPYILLFFTAYLSLNLAFVNALPIPALDGGRVLLVLVEVLRRGKKLSPDREALINLAGMGLLLLLMLVVTLNDIGHLFGR